MTTYLLLFRNASAANGYLATTEDMMADMPAWQAWIGQIAMQGKLVHTAPIAYEAAIVNGEGVVSQGHPYKDEKGVLLSGFLLCQSARIEEVQEWAKSCPIHKYPLSSVEIRALVPFQL